MQAYCVPSSCVQNLLSFPEGTRLLYIRLVKGAFCLGVRATRILSTISVSYFSSDEKAEGN